MRRFSGALAVAPDLVPALRMAGTQKFAHFTNTAEWFGSSDYGLGLPMPYLLVFLVASFETLGRFGFCSLRVPTPLDHGTLDGDYAGAGFTAHWPNGWLGDCHRQRHFRHRTHYGGL